MAKPQTSFFQPASKNKPVESCTLTLCSPDDIREFLPFYTTLSVPDKEITARSFKNNNLPIKNVAEADYFVVEMNQGKHYLLVSSADFKVLKDVVSLASCEKIPPSLNASRQFNVPMNSMDLKKMIASGAEINLEKLKATPLKGIQDITTAVPRRVISPTSR